MINDASVVIGGGNWGIKEADVLGYKLINDEYYARDIDFANSTAAGTYTDSTGVIRKAPYNLVTSSSDFSQSYSLLNSTITTNTITDPFGTLLGDSQLETIATDVHAGYNDYTAIVGSQYTYSVYVKSINGRDVRVSGSSGFDGPVAVVNLSNGAILSSAGTIQVTNAGNGWYRISITATATTTNARILIYSTVGTQLTFAGDVTKGVYLFGRQLVEGTEALPYFPTTTRLNVPRIDYRNADGSLSTVGRLLIEPQRSNVLTYSDQFDNAIWTKGTTTVTANTDISPDGTQNADRMTIVDSTSRISQALSLGAGTYTISVYVRVISTTTAGIVRLNSTVDSVSTNFFFTPTSQWARYTTTVTAATGFTAIALRGTSPGFVGTLAVWGFQVETGAYPTTYIPTTTASVTRNADSASRTGVSSWIGQTEGTLFIDINYNQPTSDANGRLLQVYAGTETTNAILPLIFGSGANVNQFQLAVSSAGASTVAIVASAATLVPFGRQKFAIAYNAGVYTVYRNGSLFASATNVAPTSLSVIELGGSSSLARNLSNPINQAAIFTTRLTNEQLQSLTTL